jgi:hypothetical protein
MKTAKEETLQEYADRILKEAGLPVVKSSK